MVKLTDELKRTIFIKVKRGTKIKDIMDEYKISRSSCQRIMNSLEEVPTEDESDDESGNESPVKEQKELEYEQFDTDNEQYDTDNESVKTSSVFNEINRPDTEDEEEEEDEPVITRKEIEPIYTPKRIKKPSNAEMHRFMKSYKPEPEPYEEVLQQQQQKPQPKRNIALDKDLPDKRNRINQIKRYIYEFESKLTDIIGQSSETKKEFISKLNDLSVNELDIVLDNVRFVLSESKIKHVFTDAFFLMTSQCEQLGKKFNYKVEGLTIELKKNNEIYQCLTELSCKYDVTEYVSAETRLMSCIALTAMSLHQQNTLKGKMNEFLDDPVSKDLQDKYSEL